MYGVVEDPKYEAAWKTGPEYQFIDDVGFPQKLEDWQKAGANYAMHVARRPEAAQAGRRMELHADRRERNARRALAERQEGPRVRALDAAWNKLRDSGKWKDAPDYGKTADRPHRAAGPRQRLLVPQRQAEAAPVRIAPTFCSKPCNSRATGSTADPLTARCPRPIVPMHCHREPTAEPCERRARIAGAFGSKQSATRWR